MPINLDDKKIDPNSATYAKMLDNLQGNILKGHGRDHTVHIFIEFKGTAASIRKALLPILDTYVTSAMRQHREGEEFKKFHIPGGLFGNFFLTARGYRALGFTQAKLTSTINEQFFLDGMAAHVADLNDPAPATWDAGFSGAPIHAMLLLADDDQNFLEREARAVISKLQVFSNVLDVERGVALRTDEGEGIEHFGYVDGRSQPIFFLQDMDGEGDIDKWDPAERLGLALVADKTVPAAVDAFGSYFVFRKLEQDVLRFTVREHALADELGLVGADRERAGAMAVGRFRDGTPLTLTQTDGFLPTKENNFTYAGDVDGLKCPFHGHIRKTNPRGDIEREFGLPEQEAERPRRIVRRGITYGDRNRHPNAFQALDDLPTKDVGLLFMCFQANIKDQFAFMQQSWANNPGFLKPATGLDPIIGQQGAGPVVPQQWNKQYDVSSPQDESFGSFVTLKGGEFFFAPSLPFLRKLAP